MFLAHKSQQKPKSTIRGIVITPDYSKIKVDKPSEDTLRLRERLRDAKRKNDQG
jgi:hypothetical protein